MKLREIINIPKGTKFLSEVIADLPENCIFNKSVTGAGGTHVALTSKQHYVICVPFKNLIKNKLERYTKLGYDILGVDGTISDYDIRDYLDKAKTVKIIVTYDSLGRVANALEDIPSYDSRSYLDEVNLLVDEFHLLLTSYVFRNDAVRTVLDCYKSFKSYCFMTATPIEDDFMLDELVNEDLIIAEWEECLEVTVKSKQCENNVKGYIKEEIEKYLKGEKDGNAYFFINSVKFIKEMVRECKLTNKNTRAIWSENNEEEGVGVKNSSINSDPKKINFLTSTCFDGVDLFDENGVTYIVSDGDRQHTLIDISTSFIQVSGRIRDSKYKDKIYHIYTNTRYSGLKSIEEFNKYSKEILSKTPRLLNDLTTVLKSVPSDMGRLTDGLVNVIIGEANESYINYDRVNKTLYYDNNLVKFDLYNFKICKCLYSLNVNLQTEYTLKGFNVEYEFFNDGHIKLDKPRNKSFKDTVIELENNQDDEKLFQLAFKKYDFLEEAIDKLGYDGIENLKYKTTNIKNKLVIISDKGEENKILALLKNKLSLEYKNFYSNIELKNLFSDIYKDLNIVKLAKGSDINKYYNTKIGSVPIEGKSTKGFYIYTEKTILG
jgi:hypothetical protein